MGRPFWRYLAQEQSPSPPGDDPCSFEVDSKEKGSGEKSKRIRAA